MAATDRCTFTVVTCPGREFRAGAQFEKEEIAGGLHDGIWPVGMTLRDEQGRHWIVRQCLILTFRGQLQPGEEERAVLVPWDNVGHPTALVCCPMPERAAKRRASRGR